MAMAWPGQARPGLALGQAQAAAASAAAPPPRQPLAFTCSGPGKGKIILAESPTRFTTQRDSETVGRLQLSSTSGHVGWWCYYEHIRVGGSSSPIIVGAFCTLRRFELLALQCNLIT
jgi:hypothetical protein